MYKTQSDYKTDLKVIACLPSSLQGLQTDGELEQELKQNEANKDKIILREARGIAETFLCPAKKMFLEPERTPAF